MKWTLPILAILLLALLAGGEATQAQGGYDLSWWTVDDGGATFSSGGNYTLGGTAGQHDAGALSGGNYTLSGGFWGGGVVAPGGYKIMYMPLIFSIFQAEPPPFPW